MIKKEVGATGKLKVISVIGRVDSGKTTLISKLSGLDLNQDEYRGITQDSSFIKMKDFILMDTPGHEDFTNDRNLALEISDLILLVVDSNKINQGELNFLKENPSSILCRTKIDIDPEKFQLPSISNLIFYLPEDLEKLKIKISEKVISKNHTVGIILSAVRHKGIGKGYDFIRFSNEKEFFILNQKVKVLKEMNEISNSEMIDTLKSKASSFITLDVSELPLHFPYLATLEPITKTFAGDNKTDNLKKSLLCLRCSSWGQIKAIKNLISRINSNVFDFKYNGIGKLSSKEEKLISAFNIRKINFGFRGADFQSIYEIEREIKSILRNIKIKSLEHKAKLRVEKIFPREGVRAKILGAELISGNVKTGDSILIAGIFCKIISITKKGVKVKDPVVREKFGFLLDGEDFEVKKGTLLLVYGKEELKRLEFS